MDGFDLIIFLIVVNIGFLILVIALFCYIIIDKIIASYQIKRKHIFFKKLEDAFLSFLISNDASDIKKVLNEVSSWHIEQFIEYISIYLTNIKGNDFEKIINVIYESELYKKICDLVFVKDIDIKLYSIYFLGLMKKPVCMNILLSALEDSNFFVRIAAIKSLAQCGCFEALERALETLSKEKLMTDYKLIEILWHFGEKACPHFFEILEKKDGSLINTASNDPIASAVIELLGYFKYFVSASLIHKILKKASSVLIIKSCIYSLGKMVYTEALEDIEKQFDSPDSEIRLSAVKAILEFRSFSSIERLQKLLNDADWNIRYNAGLALYEMGFDFQNYMFASSSVNFEAGRVYRTIVHILTEKHAAEKDA